MAEQKLFRLTISKVDGPLFSGEVISATVPGSDGQMTILAHHEPFITLLSSGVITVRTQNGEQVFEISSGTLEVSNNQATVLV